MTTLAGPIHLFTREGMTYCKMQWSTHDIGAWTPEDVDCPKCRAIFRERNAFVPAEWD